MDVSDQFHVLQTKGLSAGPETQGPLRWWTEDKARGLDGIYREQY